MKDAMPKGRKRPPVQTPRADGNCRRTCYSASLALEICARLANGEKWALICNRGRLPHCSALSKWRDKHAEFAEALAQAREIARERAGPLTGDDLEHLKGLLMAKKASGPGKPRPGRRNIVHVRYGPRVAREICEHLAAGEIWSQIAGAGRLPSVATFYRWRRDFPEFAAAVEDARRYAAEARFDAALVVAQASTPATVQSDKLHVATLFAHAEKLDPDRFGRGAGSGEPRIRRIVIRRFERAVREDGTEYVRAIDSVQEQEDER